MFVRFYVWVSDVFTIPPFVFYNHSGHYFLAFCVGLTADARRLKQSHIIAGLPNAVVLDRRG